MILLGVDTRVLCRVRGAPLRTWLVAGCSGMNL
jgi:hypothetical protein